MEVWIATSGAVLLVVLVFALGMACGWILREYRGRPLRRPPPPSERDEGARW